MTTPDGNTQEHHFYDFSDTKLWTLRVNSVDNAMDATFKLFNNVVVTVGDLNVRKLIQLIREAGGKDYGALVDEALRAEEGGAKKHLMDAIRQKFEEGNLDRVSFYGYGLLRSLLLYRLMSVSAEEGSASSDNNFELKQMLGLYLLVAKLNNFFWGGRGIKGLIETSLREHEGAESFAPLHLYREVFRLAAVDAEILQKAILQRRWHIDPFSDGYDRTSQSRALLITDKLSLMALAPFQKQLPNHEEVKAITYFTRETHIRRPPYTDRYILVGLSYDLVSLPVNIVQGKAPAFEVLAIPHEVGHYIFHYAHLEGAITFEGLSEQLVNNPYYAWCEEIFADTYGCLVAGPLTALGLQAVFATGDRDHLWVDDTEHPTTIFRPYMLSEILRELNSQQPDRYPFTAVLKSLDANWSEILTRQGFVLSDMANGRPAKIRLPSRPHDYVVRVVDVEMILNTLRPIIQLYVQHLLDYVDFAPWPANGGYQLSAEVPWTKKDVTSLSDYDDEIIKLTDSDFAFRGVPGYEISDTGRALWSQMDQAADEALQDFLDNWSDSGPGGGTGDHPH